MSPRYGSGGGGKSARPGTIHEVTRDGETIEDIATDAYGSSTGPLSAALGTANAKPGKTKLKVGDRIVIPGNPPAVKLTGKDKDEMTVMVGGREMSFISAKLIRSMDTASDGWVAQIPWTPGEDKELDRLTRPFGYERAAVYIGNDLQINGRLYTVAPEMTDKGMTKELHGFSFSIDAVDSSAPPPYEINGQTLQNIAKMYAHLVGVDAVFQWDPGGAFDRVSLRPGETMFQLLARLASQRGGLVSCLPTGDMLFLQANTAQKSVGVLEESGAFVLHWKAVYDGRKRWHEYKCITAGVKGRHQTGPLSKALVGPQAAESKKMTVVVDTDDAVPMFRTQTFRADNVTPGNVKNAARWRRNKQFADAMTTPYPVESWYAPDGTRWEENKIVTVKSATLGVAKGFDFLIRSVEFEVGDHGKSAVLHLIPPHAFTEKELGEIWTY